MNYSKIGAIFVAASLSLASLAQAQPRGPGPGPDHRPAPQHPAAQPGGPQFGGPQHGPRHAPPPPPKRHDARGPGDHRPMPPHARGVGPNHEFHKGKRLPPEWRKRQNVVNDWRGHRLSAPPRGQQWVQVGADYALVAIATGVITALVLNN